MRAKRWLIGALAATTALTAIGVTAASGTPQRAPRAMASAANCNGKAFSPTQSGKLLTSKGRLSCTGDVARMRLRTCLEQQRSFRFVTVECGNKVRFSPGALEVVVQHRCAASASRAFRTRSFLFLRDVSGQTARGKAVSDLRVYPRLCN